MGWARLAYSAYVVVVLVLLLAPIRQEVAPVSFTWFDKVIHFGLFGGMVMVGFWTRLSLGRGVAHATGLASLAEVLQAPITYRSADPWDFLAGVLGALAAAVAVTTFTRRGGGETT